MAFDRPKELLKPIKPRWIVLSFVLAIAVELLPLDATLANWLPDFTAMLALYWTLNQPRRFGIGWSFGIGLIADPRVDRAVHPRRVVLVDGFPVRIPGIRRDHAQRGSVHRITLCRHIGPVSSVRPGTLRGHFTR